MTVDPGTAAYFLGIIANCFILAACLVFGRRYLNLCRVAIWLNGAVTILGAIFLFWLLNEMQNNHEAGLAMPAAILFPAPFVAAFLALLAVKHWRMRPKPETAPQSQ
jgi:hypothetical protein